MVKCWMSKKAVLVLAGVLIFSLSLSSCDSLRKKFTRQKKKGDATEQAFVPVLEPQEYPAPENNPEEGYRQHYSLIKAWYHDLWTGIEDRSTSKYLGYIIRQVTTNIEQMKAFVDQPTQANLTKLAGFLDYYRQSLDVPWEARNISRIHSDLRAFDRFLRGSLRSDKIKDHFVKK